MLLDTLVGSSSEWQRDQAANCTGKAHCMLSDVECVRCAGGLGQGSNGS